VFLFKFEIYISFKGNSLLGEINVSHFLEIEEVGSGKTWYPSCG